MIDFDSIGKNVPILESRDLCKYFGGLRAVENVDMRIMAGDIFDIIGPSGAGKTTSFNMCTGMYTPTKGKVYLMGRDVTRFLSEKVARERMARTLQNLQLFKFMSVLDNVKIRCRIRAKSNMLGAIIHTRTYKQDKEYTVSKNKETLEAIGLFEYRDTMTGSLAYSMQRKVETTRALALEPYILSLGGPTAGVNPLEIQELVEFIKMLNESGYAIAVTEHDMKFVMNPCNRILVLNFGQKICEGTPDEVKANHQVQEAYFGKGIIIGEVAKVHA